MVTWSYDWNTSNGYLNGYHAIVAEAIDTRGNSATQRVDVIVKNDTPDNIPPVAALNYTRDGTRYYFYPYDCYDPDGFIVKYEYTIYNAADNPVPMDSHACYPVIMAECNPSDDSQTPPDECNPPEEGSGFSLFYSCPYISYLFPRPGTYKVKL